MQAFKRLNVFVRCGNSGLHLAANSTLFENSCWELRKEARKSGQANQYSGLDKKFYRPCPLDQRKFKRTWVTNCEEPRGVCVDEDEADTSRYQKGDRMDDTHYQPKSLDNRLYNRTWADYEDDVPTKETD